MKLVVTKRTKCLDSALQNTYIVKWKIHEFHCILSQSKVSFILHCWNWHLCIQLFTSFHPKHMKSKFVTRILCMRFTLFTSAYPFVLRPGIVLKILAPAAHAGTSSSSTSSSTSSDWSLYTKVSCDVFSNCSVSYYSIISRQEKLKIMSVQSKFKASTISRVNGQTMHSSWYQSLA